MQMTLPHEDVIMLWNDVVEMAHDYSDASILPWLERLSPVSLHDNVMTVSTRHNWTVKKIVNEYQTAIEALIHDITLEPITLQVVVANVTGENTAASDDAHQAMFHVKHTDCTAAEPPADSVAPSAAALAGAAAAAGRSAFFATNRPQQPNCTGTQPSPVPVQLAPIPPAVAEDVPQYEILAEPEIVSQQAVVPILEDGAVPTAAVSSGYSDFNFDTYIVGEANKLAFSMAQAVAEQPGSVTNLNPLFIWGPSGNGKTHLLFSILNYLHDNQPGMNVQYVAANAFVDQYVDDIRNKRLRGKEVLKAYRAVDVLLVDDVQFFEDKQESVSTFFDIFNELVRYGKQIVLAADTPPDYLKLDDRMRTRFSSGLVVDIKSPTYEMKQSILRSYYERCRERMPWCRVDISPKLFDTLTQLAPDNPRNMQGLMTSILLKASDDPSVLSPEGIKSAINDLFKTTETVSVSSIIRVVTSAYNVTADDVRGKKRTKNISEARQVVMWMARLLTDESYENIGAELGGRDHSTVYYGISTIEKRSLEDKSYLYKLERLKKEIVG